MSLFNEQQLLKGAREFDLDALGAIYEKYSPGVFRYALRLLGDEMLAEDCVAETFSRFLKTLQAGQGPVEYLQAYLYRIAHNWITDSYRRSPPPPLEFDETYPADVDQHPEPATEVNIKKQMVRMALRSLTPDQRQVIVLHFIEGWEIAEVAEAIGKPAGAVKALQHRGLEKLKSILLGESGDEF